MREQDFINLVTKGCNTIHQITYGNKMTIAELYAMKATLEILVENSTPKDKASEREQMQEQVKELLKTVMDFTYFEWSAKK